MATRKMDYHHNSILWRRSLSRGRKYEPVFPGVSENICIRRFELLQVVNYCDESNRPPWEDRRPEARAARISFAQTGLCVCSDTLVGSVSFIFLLSFLSLFPFLFLLLPSFLLLFFSSLPTYSISSPFLPIFLFPFTFLLRPSPPPFFFISIPFLFLLLLPSFLLHFFSFFLLSFSLSSPPSLPIPLPPPFYLSFSSLSPSSFALPPQPSVHIPVAVQTASDSSAPTA